MKVFLIFTLCFTCPEAFCQGWEQQPTKKGPTETVPHKIKRLVAATYELRRLDIDSSLSLANEAHNLALQTGDQKLICLTGLNFAGLNVQKNNYVLGKEYINKTLAIAKAINYDSAIGAAYNILGTYQFKVSQYDKSLESVLTGLSYYIKISDKQGILKSKSKIAQIYQERGDITSAERTLKEVLSIAERGSDEMLLAQHTLANLYGMQGDYEKALELDNNGIALAYEFNPNYALEKGN